MLQPQGVQQRTLKTLDWRVATILEQRRQIADPIMDRKSYMLILGSVEPTQEVVRRWQFFGQAQYKLLGRFGLNGSCAPELARDAPFLGTSEMLRDYVFRNPVDIVLVATSLSPAVSRALLGPILEIGLTVAVPRGVTVSLESSTPGRIFKRHEPFLGMDTTLITTINQRKIYQIAKRGLDLVVSGNLLVLLAPLFGLIALAIKFSSPKGPVFHRLYWIGKNGKPFTGHKFRTMVPNAEQVKQQLLAFNEMDGPVFKMRNDPRITPLGRFLRKFSLDELPQLYSVLKGDLSLVGPRAPLRDEAEKFQFWQRRKLSVKPGISCLWQINGRNEICSFDEWARLDLEYIEKASFLLDLKILLLTIPAVLSGRGAS